MAYTHDIINIPNTKESILKYFESKKYERFTPKHSRVVYLPKKEVLYGLFREGNQSILRAVKVEKMYMGHYHNYLLYVNIAGLGHRFIECGHNFYASKEDYANDKTTSILADNPTDYTDRIKYVTGEIEYMDAYFVLNRWGWWDNQIHSWDIEFATAYDVATDTYEVLIDSEVAARYPYGSKESCVEDNEVVVCDFDTEETATKQKKKEVWVEVMTDFNFESNLSEEQIKEKVRESFNGKNYRCFINGDLAIEDC